MPPALRPRSAGAAQLRAALPLHRRGGGHRPARDRVPAGAGAGAGGRPGDLRHLRLSVGRMHLHGSGRGPSRTGRAETASGKIGGMPVASAPGVPGAASVRVQHVMSRLTGGRDAATTRGARSCWLCSPGQGQIAPPPSTHRYGPAHWHVRLATAVKSRCQTDAVISLVNDRRTPGKACARVDCGQRIPYRPAHASFRAGTPLISSRRGDRSRVRRSTCS